jgi:hypothetical protein
LIDHQCFFWFTVDEVSSPASNHRENPDVVIVSQLHRLVEQLNRRGQSIGLELGAKLDPVGAEPDRVQGIAQIVSAYFDENHFATTVVR